MSKTRTDSISSSKSSILRGASAPTGNTSMIPAATAHCAGVIDRRLHGLSAAAHRRTVPLRSIRSPTLSVSDAALKPPAGGSAPLPRVSRPLQSSAKRPPVDSPPCRRQQFASAPRSGQVRIAPAHALRLGEQDHLRLRVIRDPDLNLIRHSLRIVRVRATTITEVANRWRSRR